MASSRATIPNSGCTASTRRNPTSSTTSRPTCCPRIRLKRRRPPRRPRRSTAKIPRTRKTRGVRSRGWKNTPASGRWQAEACPTNYSRVAEVGHALACQRPELCGWVRVQPAQFLAQGLHAFSVDHLVRFAEVIQLVEVAGRAMAELGTAPVTDRLVLADLALGVSDGLLRGEGIAPRAARDFAPRIQIHVAQFPAALHEKIAGVDVAVVLHHHVAVARLAHGAVAGFLAGEGFGDIVEAADAHLAALRPPHLENLAKEAPVLLRRDGVGQGRAIRRELRQRNELQVIDAHALVKLVQFARLLHVGLAEHAQNVEIHFLRLQQLDALDDTLPGAALFLAETEAVVDLFRPIQRHAEQPLILAEQVAPVLVEQDGVGL